MAPWSVVWEVPCPEVALGRHRFDVRHRALVMGTVSRSTEIDGLMTCAERLRSDGANALDVDCSSPCVPIEEDLDRTIPMIETLHARLDMPLAVTTPHAQVLRAALAAGAVVGHDTSGSIDAGYLEVVAAAGASVLVTGSGTISQRPGEPPIDAARRALTVWGEATEVAGLPRDRVLLDAGLHRMSFGPRPLELLRSHHRLAELGWPIVISTSDVPLIPVLPGDGSHVPIGRYAVQALGIALGVRVLRTHDVRGARRTADVMAAVLSAREARSA